MSPLDPSGPSGPIVHPEAKHDRPGRSAAVSSSTNDRANAGARSAPCGVDGVAAEPGGLPGDSRGDRVVGNAAGQDRALAPDQSAIHRTTSAGQASAPLLGAGRSAPAAAAARRPRPAFPNRWYKVGWVDSRGYHLAAEIESPNPVSALALVRQQFRDNPLVPPLASQWRVEVLGAAEVVEEQEPDTQVGLL